MRRPLLSSVLALLVFGAAANAHADRVWAFGDSLSDNGNLSVLFATDGVETTYLPEEAYTVYDRVPLPPEAGGGFLPLQRISTGVTVTEYIADFYGTTLKPSALEPFVGGIAANNFAIFGARAALTSQLDFPYQVAQLAGRVAAGVDVSEDRAVILIGANDVFAAWGEAIAPLSQGGDVDMDTAKATLDAAVASLRAYTLGEGSDELPWSLKTLGLKKFVILNVPGIESTPWVTQTAEALGQASKQGKGKGKGKGKKGKKGKTVEDEVLDAAEELTKYFNKQLKALVEEMEDADLDVVTVDINKANKKIRKKYDDFGFTNRTDDCYLTNTLATLTQGVPPTPGEFREICGADKTEEFMFIDTAHPTGAVHREIANRVLECLPDAE